MPSYQSNSKSRTKPKFTEIEKPAMRGRTDCQITFLHAQKRADGTWAHHWKPSPRLRRLHCANRHLGNTHSRQPSATIIAAALDLNEAVAQRDFKAASPRQPNPYTFANLVTAYRASSEWGGLKPSTQKEYGSRLRSLASWASAGQLPITAIDRAKIRDLRTELLAPTPDGTAGSKHKTAAMMRVLRLLLNWSVEYGYLETNEAALVKIPQPPARTAIILPDDVNKAEAAAERLLMPSLALSFPVAFWTLQRQADLLRLDRKSWCQIDDIADADAAALANPCGNVMGFQLQQNKTGTFVTCPIPPFLHDRIEEAFKRSQFLFPDDEDISRGCPQWLFQRRARKALNAANMAQYQFHDLRRSGMSMMRNLGVADSTPISGHAILGRTSILDTYMPATTRAACASMATAMRALQRHGTKGNADYSTKRLSAKGGGLQKSNSAPLFTNQ